MLFRSGTKVWMQTKKKNERTGELYVVGPSVGFGYINNIELTKSNFFLLIALLAFKVIEQATSYR